MAIFTVVSSEKCIEYKSFKQIRQTSVRMFLVCARASEWLQFALSLVKFCLKSTRIYPNLFEIKSLCQVHSWRKTKNKKRVNKIGRCRWWSTFMAIRNIWSFFRLTNSFVYKINDSRYNWQNKSVENIMLFN